MKVFTTIISLFICAMLIAQPAEIVTDRPDQTEAAAVVGKGVFQVETGVVFTRTDLNLPGDAVDKTNDIASTLIRIGLFRNIELRLISGYTTYQPGFLNAPEVSGLQPLAVGGKFALLSENGCWPEVALIGHLTLPWIGEEDFAPVNVAPDFRFSIAHTLSDRFSLGCNLGMYWDGNDPRGHFLYTIALGASIAGPLGAFVELYGEIPERSNWQNLADFGLTVLASPDLQFDASYGFSLSKDVDEHFLNAGLSFRLGAKRQYIPVD